MCLAVPMTIKTINGENALVERDGVSTEIKITLVPEVRIGDQVLVHAGFAIEKLDSDDAKQIEAAWDEYVQSLQDS